MRARIPQSGDWALETDFEKYLFCAPPRDIISAPPIGKIWQRGSFAAIIEKLVQRDFERRRDSV
jgi:hypothetical protein